MISCVLFILGLHVSSMAQNILERFRWNFLAGKLFEIWHWSESYIGFWGSDAWSWDLCITCCVREISM